MIKCGKNETYSLLVLGCILVAYLEKAKMTTFKTLYISSVRVVHLETQIKISKQHDRIKKSRYYVNVLNLLTKQDAY